MREIYIARHGITESNKAKIYMGESSESLAWEGIKQAEALGKCLRPLKIQSIFSSSIQRALDTAKIANRWINVPIIVEEDLDEMRLGPWRGMAEDEVEIKFPNEFKIWDTKPAELVLKGRESIAEVQERAVRGIYKIIEKSDNFPVLTVTHVAIVRCLILYFNKLDLNLYRRIAIPNASLFCLRIDENSAHVSRYP
jgi:broad specificity phosphatase PhoE